MIVTTTEGIPGKKSEILEVVFGSTVRAKNISEDIMAGIKKLVGGELEEYTEMIADARKEAFNRMINHANEAGADAIVGVRFSISEGMFGVAELLAYGTAVKLK